MMFLARPARFGGAGSIGSGLRFCSSSATARTRDIFCSRTTPCKSCFSVWTACTVSASGAGPVSGVFCGIVCTAPSAPSSARSLPASAVSYCFGSSSFFCARRSGICTVPKMRAISSCTLADFSSGAESSAGISVLIGARGLPFVGVGAERTGARNVSGAGAGGAGGVAG